MSNATITPKVWIPYSISESPAILTDEDIVSAKSDQILEFYTGLRITFMIRAESLPETITESTANTLFTYLFHEIDSDEYMDVGWVDEYIHAAQEISHRMRGHPKELRKQIAKLQRANQTPSGRRKLRHAKRVKSKAGEKFLALPQKVRDRIYRLLLVRGSVTICDWSVASIRAMKSISRRTEYDVHDSQSKSLKRTTYSVRTEGYDNPVGLGIMGVCRQTYLESSKIFYEENQFRFLGTGDSVLAFIHDRARRLDLMRRVEIRFSCNYAIKFKGCYNSTCPIPAAPPTWLPCWRRIANLFVHSSMGLEDFKLSIDDTFWQHASWGGPDKSAAAVKVFTTKHLCERHPSNAPSQHSYPARNFLQHVARLGGVNISIGIDGDISSAERIKFSRELLAVMEANKHVRPYLADDSIPRCTCNRKYLKESCLWDKDGRLSRGPRHQTSYIVS